MEQNTRRPPVRNLLESWQVPLLENEGVRVWKARTVPVGRRFARLAALAIVRGKARVVVAVAVMRRGFDGGGGGEDG